MDAARAHRRPAGGGPRAARRRVGQGRGHRQSGAARTAPAVDEARTTQPDRQDEDPLDLSLTIPRVVDPPPPPLPSPVSCRRRAERGRRQGRATRARRAAGPEGGRGTQAPARRRGPARRRLPDQTGPSSGEAASPGSGRPRPASSQQLGAPSSPPACRAARHGLEDGRRRSAGGTVVLVTHDGIGGFGRDQVPGRSADAGAQAGPVGPPSDSARRTSPVTISQRRRPGATSAKMTTGVPVRRDQSCRDARRCCPWEQRSARVVGRPGPASTRSRRPRQLGLRLAPPSAPPAWSPRSGAGACSPPPPPSSRPAPLHPPPSSRRPAPGAARLALRAASASAGQPISQPSGPRRRSRRGPAWRPQPLGHSAAKPTSFPPPSLWWGPPPPVRPRGARGPLLVLSLAPPAAPRPALGAAARGNGVSSRQTRTASSSSPPGDPLPRLLGTQDEDTRAAAGQLGRHGDDQHLGRQGQGGVAPAGGQPVVAQGAQELAQQQGLAGPASQVDPRRGGRAALVPAQEGRRSRSAPPRRARARRLSLSPAPRRLRPCRPARGHGHRYSGRRRPPGGHRADGRAGAAGATLLEDPAAPPRRPGAAALHPPPPRRRARPQAPGDSGAAGLPAGRRPGRRRRGGDQVRARGGSRAGSGRPGGVYRLPGAAGTGGPQARTQLGPVPEPSEVAQDPHGAPGVGVATAWLRWASRGAHPTRAAAAAAGRPRRRRRRIGRRRWRRSPAAGCTGRPPPLGRNRRAATGPAGVGRDAPGCSRPAPGRPGPPVVVVGATSAAGAGPGGAGARRRGGRHHVADGPDQVVRGEPPGWVAPPRRRGARPPARPAVGPGAARGGPGGRPPQDRRDAPLRDPHDAATQPAASRRRRRPAPARAGAATVVALSRSVSRARSRRKVTVASR